MKQMPNTRIVKNKNGQKKRPGASSTLVPTKEADAFIQPTHDYFSPAPTLRTRNFWFCFDQFFSNLWSRNGPISGFFGLESGPNCSKWAQDRLISLVHPKWPNMGCAKNKVLTNF